MKECSERIISVGFTKDPKLVFDEVECIAAEMLRQGWILHDSYLEDGLGNIHLFFERNIEMT